MKRILFPTDFSKETEQALEYAVYFARNTGMQLILLNAFDLKYLHPDLPRGSYDMEEDRSREKLNELRQQILSREENKGMDIDLIAAFGSTLRTMEEVAKQEHVDLIVMGTKGVSAVKDFFTDSMTFRTIERVDCPVIVIPEDKNFKQFQKILFATDFTNIPEKSLNTLKELAKGIGAAIKIVNVNREFEEPTVAEAREGLHINRIFGEEVEHDFEFVQDEKVLQGLEAYIDQNPEIGMLVMISHERLDWLEKFVSPRLSKQMVHHPLLPTMIMKS